VNNDEELLSLLGRAFRPAQGEPPPGLISAVRDSVANQAGKVAKGLPRRRLWLGRRRVAVLAGAALLVSTGPAYAAVAGIPDPVRSAAHAVGLPVTPPAINDLHAAEGKLRDALARHDQSEAIRQAANVRERLSGLSAGDRAHEEEAADSLLDKEAALSKTSSPTVAPATTVPGAGAPGEEPATTLPIEDGSAAATPATSAPSNSAVAGPNVTDAVSQPAPTASSLPSGWSLPGDPDSGG
jgi:hypothetical protein